MQINRNGELVYVEIRMRSLTEHHDASKIAPASNSLIRGGVPVCVSFILWEGSVSFP